MYLACIFSLMTRAFISIHALHQHINTTNRLLLSVLVELLFFIIHLFAHWQPHPNIDVASNNIKNKGN